MRFSIAILAAAAIGFGSAAVVSSPAEAGPAAAVPSINHDAGVPAAGLEQVQYRTRGRHVGPRGHAYRHAAPRRYHRGHHPRHSQRHYRHRDRGSAAAAGIIGFATGAILGQALTSPHYRSAHVEWCQARYRSYDVHRDVFRGYDGNLYRCRSPYVRG